MVVPQHAKYGTDLGFLRRCSRLLSPPTLTRTRIAKNAPPRLPRRVRFRTVNAARR